MRRPRTKPDAPTAPVAIDPNSVWTPAQVMAAFGIPLKGLRRAVREDGLRKSRRGRHYYFLGSWLLEWIRAGEITPRTMEASANGQH